MKKFSKLDNPESGSIEIICGPMFSGKTERLISIHNTFKIANVPVLVFKPTIDTRYNVDKVSSHSGLVVKATPQNNTSSIKAYFEKLTPAEKGIEILFFDEVQFFDKDFPEFINKLANEGKTIFCAGLDTNFRGEPFQVTKDILAIADTVTKLSAICNVCKKYGTRSQRLINGKPASKNDPEILIGDAEAYECRCRKHHII